MSAKKESLGNTVKGLVDAGHIPSFEEVSVRATKAIHPNKWYLCFDKNIPPSYTEEFNTKQECDLRIEEMRNWHNGSIVSLKGSDIPHNYIFRD